MRRTGRATVASAVEGVADDVADKRGADDLGGVGAGVDDVDEGIGGDQQTEEGGDEAGDGGPANPAWEGGAEAAGSDEWNGEHGEVSDLVVGDAGVGEGLKGFLRSDSYVAEEEKQQDERTGEDDGVRRGAVARVKAGEPCRDEV